MMTYHTGLQIVNHTPFKIVAGSISYLTNEVEKTGFNGSILWEEKQDGNTVTCSGPLDIAPNSWMDRYVELYAHSGTILLPVTLTLENGQEFTFTINQKYACQEVDKPQSVAVTDKTPPPYEGAIGVTFTTRRDAEIQKTYNYGLVMATIIDQQTTARWMTDNRALDPYKINQITLPGTHDTGTWSESGNPQCQSMDLRHQLNAGIRFLDIRVELLSNIGDEDMRIYHGVMPTDYYLEKDIISACEAFLASNPDETVVMMVSRNTHFLDSIADWTWDQILKLLGGTPVDDQYFSHLMAKILAGHTKILTGSAIPTVSDARGHIVLVTRYHQGPGIALPVKQWPDDTTGRIQLPGVDVEIQDMYKFGGLVNNPGKVDNKWKVVEPHLDAARRVGNNDPSTWYINFTSGSGFPGNFNPDDMAKGIGHQNGINARLADYLGKHPKGYYGTVMMDYPEFPPPGDLIEKLIKSNP
jgi:hypothetical protein